MASSSGNEAQSGGAWDRVGTSHTMATAQPGDELTHWLPTDAIQQAPLHRESIPVGRHYMLGLNLGISQAAKRGGFALRGRLPNGERLPRELATRIAQMVTKQAQREARMWGHRFRLCRRAPGSDARYAMSAMCTINTAGARSRHRRRSRLVGPHG